MKKLRIKSIISIICFSVGLAIFIYLFFMPYAYVVNFKTSQSPISVYSFVHENSLDICENEKGIYFTQILKNEDTQLHWRVESGNKGSDVQIKIVFNESNLKEKIRILTFRSSLLEKILKRIKKMYKSMSDDFKSFSWTTPLKNKLSEINCLCIQLDSKIREKPKLMNQNVDLLAYHSQNKLKLPPKLYINDIDFINQKFSYEFCFPIGKSGVYKPLPEEFYIKKQIVSTSHSIDFYGNFAATQRFWAKLYDSLRLENDKISYPVVEEFLDSPFSGIDDKEWKSKLYF